jgi:hypothetical protein
VFRRCQMVMVFMVPGFSSAARIIGQLGPKNKMVL